MNPNMKLWIDALRSGDYEQTSGKLQNHHTYCCLGVACDLYAQKTGRGRWGEPDSLGNIGFETNNSAFPEYSALPHVVAEWVGIDLKAVSRCIDWNDSARLSFKQIAHNLEAHCGE